MKLNLTDGYLVNSTIIWGELDYRGYVTIGYEIDCKFNYFHAFKKLPGRKQIVWNDGLFVYVSLPLKDHCPPTSIFNLGAKRLKDFYYKTHLNIMTMVDVVTEQISTIIGQEIQVMSDEDLYLHLATFFDPASEGDFELDLSKSIYSNCFPSRAVKATHFGLELNDCHHCVILIDKFQKNYLEIFDTLNEYFITMNLTEQGSQILVRSWALTHEEIIQSSRHIKELIHSLPRTDYYEPNDRKETLKLFESSIPGWIYGKAQTYAEVVPCS
jgi:hypothetical protein